MLVKVALLSCFFLLALSQTIPDGTPRLSGAGYVTTDCKNLVLGQEPPFPNNYLDEVNNYLYPAIRQLQSQRDLPGNYRRTFHFPTIGCATGTLTMNANLPPSQSAGIFQPGASYPAFVRISGFDQATQNTTGGDTKGFAIKLSNVPGPKLLPGFENDTHFDFVFNAAPVFTSNNETVFSALVMSRSQLGGGGDRNRAPFGVAYPIPQNRTVQEHLNNTVFSVLTMPFFAISPFRYGNGSIPQAAVKYRLYPCAGVLPMANTTGASANYLSVDMANRLANSSYCYYFQIQFQTDTCLHPINDFGVEWLQTDTPYITIGVLNLPVQNVLNDSDPLCRHTAMNVWRVTAEHRPLGSLNRARLFAMMNSHNQRLSLDNVVEPFEGQPLPGFQFFVPEDLQINANFTVPQLKFNFPGDPLRFYGGPGSTIFQPSY
jgi:hypothetical protein